MCIIHDFPTFREWKQAEEDALKAWIITYTGKKFYHLRPDASMVDIEDIAHALSMICRWTGHTKFHYSVAQHSYYCSYLMRSDKLSLAALLHDASEAYLGDMNRPLKHFTPAGPAYLKIEEAVERVIFTKFGLPYPMPAAVKDADSRMLYTEKEQLMPTHAWTTKWGGSVSEGLNGISIERWTPRRAEKMFLRRFKELYQEK